MRSRFEGSFFAPNWQRCLLVTCFVSMLSLATIEVHASSYKLQKRRLDPLIIKFCVNELLYEGTFANGNPSGDRTIVDPASAARACKGVSSKEEAREQ